MPVSDSSPWPTPHCPAWSAYGSAMLMTSPVSVEMGAKGNFRVGLCCCCCCCCPLHKGGWWWMCGSGVIQQLVGWVGLLPTLDVGMGIQSQSSGHVGSACNARLVDTTRAEQRHGTGRRATGQEPRGWRREGRRDAGGHMQSGAFGHIGVTHQSDPSCQTAWGGRGSCGGT